MPRNARVMLVAPDCRGGKLLVRPQLPVGLGYIARALETAGIEYAVTDLNIDLVEQMMCEITRFRPHLIGVSMTSFKCRNTYTLLHDLRRAFPDPRIVVGGPHVTANKERVLEECPAIDVAVVGEGEETILQMLQDIPIHTIKGTIYRDRSEVRFTGEREAIRDLDRIPFPTYRGFKLKQYDDTIQMTSSRGCPYRCTFCGAPRLLGKKWRMRSALGMLEELEYWYVKGYRKFCFNDSNFAVNRARISHFCDEIIERDLNVSFRCDGLRADHADRTVLDQMRRAGCRSVAFGVESGSDRVLRNIKKGATRAEMEPAIKAATELGFHVTLFFIIGTPGETPEDVRRSFQLARKYKVARVVFFTLAPLPGTEIYEWAINQGFVDKFQGRYPEGEFAFSNVASIGTGMMTKDEVSCWLRRARRLENQIERRYALCQSLDRITGNKMCATGIP
ncbi:MAG: B12-binding domain-containing radical SAM protein [Phycisphaerales bacterium]|nr:MAG: B12-binding domain-containing radical SAM protein [Phycisphaerales bacterium]